MTDRSTPAAAANVIGGWLGTELPPPAKHRNKSRAAYRKTERTRPLPPLIAHLKAAGCAPRRKGPGEWVAWCPDCLALGRHVGMEIRTAADGSLLTSCVEAHEPRRRAA